MNIEIGNKPIDFVFQGDELIYPSYVAKDNLVLHYDFSGRTNLDVKKGIAEDLSGNGNDGILENFAYESGSGYDSNSYLEFDNVDDFITIPELNLDVNDFTVLVDGQILSYRGDNVAKINENGLEIGGRNLIIRNDELKNSFIGLDGSITSRPNSSVMKNYIRIIPGRSYTFLRIGGGGDATPAFRWNIYDEDKVWIYRTADTLESFIWVAPIEAHYIRVSYPEGSDVQISRGTKIIDWTPAPEDVQTTKITPIFSNKIKTLMYWNKALTDTELQEVYNVQKHRI